MALFGKEGEKTISAWDAVPEGEYFCLECKAGIKLRKGGRRFPHFFHSKASPSCRLYSKSLRHLRMQYAVQKALPEGASVLEKPFPQIHRIADIVWESEKIVFEIQCSLMQEKEAKARILEYQTLGFKVVWLLDDRFFNQKRVKPAEEMLRENAAYFIGGKEDFYFYDQFEVISSRIRIRKSKPFCITLSQMHSLATQQNLPAYLEKRAVNSPYFFTGDLLSKRFDPAWETAFLYWESYRNNRQKITQASWKNRLRRIYIDLIEKLMTKIDSR